jgi:hypothetical protein
MERDLVIKISVTWVPTEQQAIAHFARINTGLVAIPPLDRLHGIKIVKKDPAFRFEDVVSFRINSKQILSIE